MQDDEAAGVSREVDRALRNMAGLGRTMVKGPDGRRVLSDPARELAQRLTNLDELRSEFASSLRLWKRTTKDLWHG